MTLSDQIETKVKRAKIVGLAFWLAFAAMIFFDNAGGLFFLAFIPFIGFGGTILYILYFIKCPNCKVELGQAAAYSGNFFQKESKLNYCPNCGVNFKEEVNNL